MQSVRNSPSPAGHPPKDAEGLAILMVGDEVRSRRLMVFGMAKEPDVVTRADSSAALDAFALSAGAGFDVALLDWEMKTTPAETMLARLRRLDSALPVVATVSDERAADAARGQGVLHCLIKPFSCEDLRLVLKTAARAKPSPPDISAHAVMSITKTAPACCFGSRSRSMHEVLQVALRVAPTSASVLFLGESGTGKTLLARGLHERSRRRHLPFVTVTCPCLQARLLESELFGHVRGAFTGAVNDTHGKVAAAEGGTLFLDEIGELPPAIQSKLLRLLQDREYERLGEVKTRRANIRVLAATNRDLQAEVRAGRFREDLFYRLNVITLDLPPLRRRPEDILTLAREFLEEVPDERTGREFTPAARRALMAHGWPGNLRELRNVVERAAILSERDMLDAGDLPLFEEEARAGAPQVGDLVSLEELARAHIREVIARTETLGQAAEVLGINPTTLYRKRKRSLPTPCEMSGAA